jgi:glycosyltransferase
MKISIITAVYNNRNEISVAIQSVLSQTYSNIEYIIIDGGSTDGTIEEVQKFADKISVFVSAPDKGIYDALNKGLEDATGDVIGILHSDDIFYSEKTLSQIAKVFEQKQCDAVYGNLLYVSKTDTSKVIRFWESRSFEPNLFRKGWMPAHPTLFMRKSVYDTFGQFDLRYKIASDYDLMLRTVGSGKLKCEYLPEVITRMRVGGASNKSLKNIWNKSYEDYLALRRNKMGGFFTLFLKNISKVGQFLRKK